MSRPRAEVERAPRESGCIAREGSTSRRSRSCARFRSRRSSGHSWISRMSCRFGSCGTPLVRPRSCDCPSGRRGRSRTGAGEHASLSALSLQRAEISMTRSELESRFLRLCRRFGLRGLSPMRPSSERNATSCGEMRDSSSRPTAMRPTARVSHSRTIGRGISRWSAPGWRVVRFTHAQIAFDPEDVRRCIARPAGSGPFRSRIARVRGPASVARGADEQRQRAHAAAANVRRHRRRRRGAEDRLRRDHPLPAREPGLRVQLGDPRGAHPDPQSFHVLHVGERTTAVWKRPSPQKSEIPPKLVKSALSFSGAQRARHSPRDGRTDVGVPKPRGRRAGTDGAADAAGPGATRTRARRPGS